MRGIIKLNEMKNLLKRLLSDGNEASMMRFGVLITLAVFGFFSLILGVVICYTDLKHHEQLSDMSFWGGISAFFGTLMLNVGTVLGIKAYQKKFEGNNQGEKTEQ